MEWILDNIRIIIFVAAAIAYWLNQSRKGWAASEEEDARDPERRQTPLPHHDGDQADRVRDIQAEIRRKIAERRAAEREPTGRPVWMEEEEEEPVAHAPTPPPPLPTPQPARSVSAPAFSAADDSAALARQQRLSDQLAEAHRVRAAAKVKLDEIWDRPAVSAAKRSAARRLDPSLSVRETLRDRAALRRAWVLREVLEKPVGLR